MKKRNVAIFLHLYAQDLAEYYHDYLHPLKDLVDIHMTLPEDIDCRETEYIFNDLNTTFNYVNNVGADNLSFLKVLTKYGPDYKMFYKMHTKKSLLHRFCNWRELLVNELVGSIDIFKQNCLLLENGFVDSIGPQCLLMTSDRCHAHRIAYLMSELNIPFDNYSHFVGGSMFGGVSSKYLKYFNREVVNNIEQLMIDNSEIGLIKDENYQGGCISTYHHALERIFGYLGNLYPITMSTITVEGINSPKQIVITKNKEVYCHHDSEIFGNVVEEKLDKLFIIWKHKRPRKIEEYIRTSENVIKKV